MKRSRFAPSEGRDPSAKIEMGPHTGIGAGAFAGRERPNFDRRALPSGPPPTAPELSARPTATQVAQLSAALNAKTDRLNELFSQVSDLFRESGLGVRSEVVLREYDDEEPGGSPRIALTYSKLDGGWGLYIERHVPDPKVPDFLRLIDVTPIERDNREVRALAGRALPRLYEQLATELWRQYTEMSEVVATVDSVVGDLSATPAPDPKPAEADYDYGSTGDE